MMAVTLFAVMAASNLAFVSGHVSNVHSHRQKLMDTAQVRNILPALALSAVFQRGGERKEHVVVLVLGIFLPVFVFAPQLAGF